MCWPERSHSFCGYLWREDFGELHVDGSLIHSVSVARFGEKAALESRVLAERSHSVLVARFGEKAALRSRVLASEKSQCFGGSLYRFSGVV